MCQEPELAQIWTLRVAEFIEKKMTRRRLAFWNSAVMVAVVTVSLSGIGGAAATYFEYAKRRSDIVAIKNSARCVNAYEYLRDDTVNQDAPVADRIRFIREQINVARDCARKDAR